MHVFITDLSSSPPYTPTIDPLSKLMQSVMKQLHTASDSVIEVNSHCMQD